MIRALADGAASTFHRLRLLLLVMLSLLVASGMAVVTSPHFADWLRFAAAIISLVGLVPLTNEVYVRWGTRGILVLGLASLLLLISQWAW